MRCPTAAPVVTPSGKTELVERLADAPVQQRKKLLTDYLRDAVAEVTRVDAAEIREDAGFFDLGMDSLMAVELRRRIEQGVGKEIPATLAMDYPRLSDVVDYLLGDVLGLSEQASAKSGPQLASAGDDAHGRADRDRRGVVPFPRRARSGSFLGGVVRRYRCDPGSPGGPIRHRRVLRPGSRHPGQDLQPLRRIPGGNRRIRSGILRYLPARGGVDRAAAAADARNWLGRAWNAPGIRRRRCAAAEPASSWGWLPTSTRICCPPSRSTKSSPTSSPAMRSMPFPVGLPSRLD